MALVEIRKCPACGSWEAIIECPSCQRKFNDVDVAVTWQREVERGTRNVGEVEGLSLECPRCGWEGGVDEFSRETTTHVYFEVDDE